MAARKIEEDFGVYSPRWFTRTLSNAEKMHYLVDALRGAALEVIYSRGPRRLWSRVAAGEMVWQSQALGYTRHGETKPQIEVRGRPGQPRGISGSVCLDSRRWDPSQVSGGWVWTTRTSQPWAAASRKPRYLTKAVTIRSISRLSQRTGCTWFVRKLTRYQHAKGSWNFQAGAVRRVRWSILPVSQS